MPDTKIKICGLTRKQDIEYVNEALPDYIGFVFAKSRRQVDFETASQLKNALDRRIKSIGVFVNENVSAISQLCKSGVIDYVQLHGDENEEYIKTLKQKVSNPIIKAIRVKDKNSLYSVGIRTNSLDFTGQSLYDFLLLDAYSTNEYGGTGKAFDWEVAKNIGRPFFLAGGICIENAIAAIESTTPYCLDISSGVETDGLKDRSKIIQLVNLVRSVK